MTTDFVERKIVKAGVPVTIQVRPETAAKMDELQKERDRDEDFSDVLAAARALLATQAAPEPPTENGDDSESEDDLLGDEKPEEKPAPKTGKGSRRGTSKADQ